MLASTGSGGWSPQIGATRQGHNVRGRRQGLCCCPAGHKQWRTHHLSKAKRASPRARFFLRTAGSSARGLARRRRTEPRTEQVLRSSLPTRSGRRSSSQMRADWSSNADITWALSGEKTTEMTLSVCPLRTAIPPPVLASQTRAVLSQDAVTSHAPSGEKAAERIGALCASS